MFYAGYFGNRKRVNNGTTLVREGKQGVAGRRLSPAEGVAEDPAGWVSELYSRRE